MRIAFVVHDFNWTWGHARYTAELASRYSREHEVHVFSNTADRGRSPEITFHHIPALRWNALSTILTFYLSAERQVRGDFDIVHAQGFCGGPSNVITAHQCNEEWHASRRRTATTIGWRERLFGKIVSALEGRLYRGAYTAQVIAISKRIEADLRRHYQCAAPVSVIYHGTDTERFHPRKREASRRQIRQQFQLGEDDFLFLHLGDVRKGAEQAIRALAKLPSGKLIVVARTTPDTYKQLAEELGLSKRVLFAGATDTPEIYFGAVDTFVCATPYDPFALVITEAMASGLAVIASKTAGAAELIEDGVEGLILNDPSDVDELSRHMKRLLEDPALAIEIGRRARAKVEPRTWDLVADETMAVYRLAAR